MSNRIQVFTSFAVPSGYISTCKYRYDFKCFWCIHVSKHNLVSTSIILVVCGTNQEMILSEQYVTWNLRF